MPVGKTFQRGQVMSNIALLVSMVVWPAGVLLGFTLIAETTASYFAYAGYFALAAFVHIPIYCGYLIHSPEVRNRWEKVGIFVCSQLFMVPIALYFILILSV
jgi:hypothetical protein